MSASPSALARLKKVIAGFEETVAVTFLAAVTVLLVTQFVTRYLLTTPLVWTEEVSRYAFVWMIFMGSAYLASKNAHIVVTFISDLVSRSAGKWIVRFAAAVVIVASAVTAWAGIEFLDQMSGLLSPATGISMAYIYAAPVVGFTLITIHSLEYLITGSGVVDGGEVEPLA